MIRHVYSQFFKLEEADRLAAKTFDVCEYLMMLHAQGKLNTDFQERRENFYYHVPCHLKSIGIGLPALDLLRLIPGLTVEELDTDCCGLGGSYGLKKETSDISMVIGQHFVRALADTEETATVLSDCEGCRLQIQELTGRKSLHPVQVVRDAYGIDLP